MLKLSDEALGAVMMALQKSLMEQSDIVPMIKDLDFQEASGELFVMNPPIVKFENDDEDILENLDLSAVKRPMQKQKRVNVDFPAWMLESLDREANRVGVTRQSIIKMWLAERLERRS